ncbi:MAG: 4-hydroxybenzoate decarboxylase, partial [Deltaproteobacteria bacterium]
ETGFHSLSAAVVHERYPREALASAFRILGEGQLSLTKFLFVTDTPMDLRDFRTVFSHVLSRVDWETDLYVFSNASMDTLDYAGPEVNKGSKGVILALGDARRALPERFEGTLPAGITRAEVFGPGALVLEGASYADERDLPARIARHPDFAAWPFIALVDDARAAVSSVPAFLWHVFTRFEPANDLHSRELRVQRHHLVYSGPVVFDSRMKPWYPKVVEADEDTAALVSRRWAEYFPGGSVVMGDSHRAHV